jgi:hypothetical protein
MTVLWRKLLSGESRDFFPKEPGVGLKKKVSSQGLHLP